ncbi:hypothetical protein HXA31_01625 [Salipaludibacillus agaradhaerens]|uniref:Uncharacterized protein n=1 Tax=Salipaludibacillus agaradhaerens TaxID=76935 RepID=A0A9Q4B3R3_SALAG|nr:hypothetical protein [Salipaludibacillus agaradhaerens]MCR6097452.1 hypothetical protein [Salipaludibacillus agaradhaerens]MCR6113064.1 hypothetical protein [Salipaludibacillus agaradhaerens]
MALQFLSLAVFTMLWASSQHRYLLQLVLQAFQEKQMCLIVVMCHHNIIAVLD